MKMLIRRVAIAAAGSLLPFAAVAAIAPAVSSAVPDCPGGWWDPAANICRPPVATTPLACDNGWWWDPVGNVCRPPVIPPQ
ncbi:hypothetical protein FZI91_15540 [Mycobacterium sp. CBMA271]|uniref:hypothetical protein n=1 Tax=unclassified Mycobacteroides TaxID=2618759 RepID=UPI0012DC787D|nr:MULTISPECIES: hypothetical protein [unclassified Mycobacteroides]MUM23109.1 hypothetical protein [Mycobacteroides sp. CBMA 271]